jgi:hypothetical protein
VWKENGVRKRAKVRKMNEGEGSGKGHFTALRLVHGVWWECDDESVKRYSAGADEGEEGEIRAVVLQKMQNYSFLNAIYVRSVGIIKAEKNTSY